MRNLQKGETIIELVLAFAIFSLAAVGTIILINNGLATTQRNLEITVVRQQIDSQAETLRYLRATDNSAWQSITSSTVVSPRSLAQSCTDLGSMTDAFFVRPTIAADPTATTYAKVDISASTYSMPPTYAKIDYADAASPSRGIWIQATRAQATSGGTQAYDFYIHACWNSNGVSTPMTLGTIVRIYE